MPRRLAQIRKPDNSLLVITLRPQDCLENAFWPVMAFHCKMVYSQYPNGILSSLQYFQLKKIREGMRGFSKIKATCRQAQTDGLDCAWIDTCCIDKTSSAELGEAINSMFKWYRKAKVCYAFLEDVSSYGIGPPLKGTNCAGFGQSRWFTRGWTLQV